jgi:hypothetical protein
LSGEWLPPNDNFDLDSFLAELQRLEFIQIHKFNTYFESDLEISHGRILEGPYGDKVILIEDSRGTTVIVDQTAISLLLDA